MPRKKHTRPHPANQLYSCAIITKWVCLMDNTITESEYLLVSVLSLCIDWYSQIGSEWCTIRQYAAFLCWWENEPLSLNLLQSYRGNDPAVSVSPTHMMHHLFNLWLWFNQGSQVFVSGSSWNILYLHLKSNTR